jgi:hypothetical protein
MCDGRKRARPRRPNTCSVPVQATVDRLRASCASVIDRDLARARFEIGNSYSQYSNPCKADAERPRVVFVYSPNLIS